MKYRYIFVANGDGSVIGSNSEAEANVASQDSYFTVVDTETCEHIDAGNRRPIRGIGERLEVEGGSYVDPNA
jgi:hypothetical protein